jgi:hypothetical protein
LKAVIHGLKPRHPTRRVFQRRRWRVEAQRNILFHEGLSLLGAEDVGFLADLMSLPASGRHPLPNLSPQRKKERILEALIRQLEFGFQVGRRRLARQPPPATETAGVSTLISGMIALMAFTMALTISFAQDRFETRRHTTLAEANTIGTAWLRTGLAGAPGKRIAALIEDYARARLAHLEAPTSDTAAASIARTSALQTRIWQGTLPALEGMPAPLAGVLVNSLNDMFDANLAPRYAFESRVPTETALTRCWSAPCSPSALSAIR